MFGTEVWKWALTSTRPRSPSFTPASSSPMPWVLALRPEATSTAAAAIEPPSLSPRVIRPSSTSTDSTVAGIRNCTPRSSIRAWSRADISRSRKERSGVRASTRMTGMPRAAKVQAYSQPMTPPPTTTSECGTSVIWRMVSES